MWVGIVELRPGIRSTSHRLTLYRFHPFALPPSTLPRSALPLSASSLCPVFALIPADCVPTASRIKAESRSDSISDMFEHPFGIVGDG